MIGLVARWKVREGTMEEAHIAFKRALAAGGTTGSNLE
jgi:hypothetical protein